MTTVTMGLATRADTADVAAMVGAVSALRIPSARRQRLLSATGQRVRCTSRFNHELCARPEESS